MNTSQEQNEEPGVTEGITGNGRSSVKKALDLFAETAGEAMDLLSWIGNRLNSNGSTFNIEEARGAKAEVSLSIPPEGTGEVMLILGRTRKSYPARALQHNQEFKKGMTVRIADVGVNTMFVEGV